MPNKTKKFPHNETGVCVCDCEVKGKLVNRIRRSCSVGIAFESNLSKWNNKNCKSVKRIKRGVWDGAAGCAGTATTVSTAVTATEYAGECLNGKWK